MKKPGDQFSAPFVPVSTSPSKPASSPEPFKPPSAVDPDVEAPTVDGTETTGHYDEYINTAAEEGDESNNAGESQPVDNRPSARGQKRDAYGRFKQAGETSGAPVRSDSQKKRDQVFSQVTKWKKKIEETIDKIQSSRPEVSQLYVLETNILKGSRKPTVFKTKGVDPRSQAADSSEGVNEDDFEEAENSLTEVDEQISSAPNSGSAKKNQPRRPANLVCFICKEFLGTNLKRRIVCAKKDCTRGPAHLACLNLRPTSASILTTIRCSYMCPAHSSSEVPGESRFETEDDDVRDTYEQTDGVPNKTRENVGTTRASAKNNNFLVAKKLSPQLMEVLGTEQRYLNVNEIRKLVRDYRSRRNLKEENQYVTPDRALALVTGNQPFKLTQIISVLQKQNSILK